MSRLHHLTAGALAVAAAACLALPAAADPAAPAKHGSCFFINEWQGWHAPDDHTLYLKVNIHDYYKVELNGSSTMLTWPDAHLINKVEGDNVVCDPIDLQLSISEGRGTAEPLFVKSITKLTPEQIAAVPAKDLP